MILSGSFSSSSLVSDFALTITQVDKSNEKQRPGTCLSCINCQCWFFNSPKSCSPSTGFWLHEWMFPYHRKHQDHDKSEGLHFRAEFSVYSVFCPHSHQTVSLLVKQDQLFSDFDCTSVHGLY